MHILILIGLSRSGSPAMNDDYDIWFTLVVGAANRCGSMDDLPLALCEKLIGQNGQFVFVRFMFAQEEPPR